MSKKYILSSIIGKHLSNNVIWDETRMKWVRQISGKKSSLGRVNYKDKWLHHWFLSSFQHQIISLSVEFSHVLNFKHLIQVKKKSLTNSFIALRFMHVNLMSCPTLHDPMDCSLPVSSVHGDSPGKNTGVGCHFFLQGIFPTEGLNLCLLHSQADSSLSHSTAQFFLKFNLKNQIRKCWKYF